MRPSKHSFALVVFTLTVAALCLPASRFADTARTALADHSGTARPYARSVGRTHLYRGYGHPAYGPVPFGFGYPGSYFGYLGGYAALYPYSPIARGYLAPYPPGPYSYHGYCAYAFQLYGYPPGVTLPHGPQQLVEPLTPKPATDVEPEPEPIPPPPPDQ